ncbi:hypothetical protein TESG_02292 [Trichophyton tonsurans CBS 112818]|uniref:Uncharacterized protein n=1 Tax=Trichophyton tonsurans (strain CBS 112818) TaxID=647933 RepID=F2RTY8_TRIT1|nr:hypothetical protein TESG_02292 [Trichophyton tonsurans CBS 112818]
MFVAYPGTEQAEGYMNQLPLGVIPAPGDKAKGNQLFITTGPKVIFELAMNWLAIN